MQAEMVSLESLKELPRNPKLHSLGQIGLSMGQFGFLERIVVNRTTGHIISGHGRMETLALRKSTGEPPPTNVEVRDGSWYVPVDWVEVPEEQEVAAAIALNRLVEAGGWDRPLLVDCLTEIGQMSLLMPGELSLAVTSELTDTLLQPLGYNSVDVLELLAQGKRGQGTQYTTVLRPVEDLFVDVKEKYGWVKTAVLDFSGGRDSTAALLWMQRNLPWAHLVAVYVDLGAEMPGFWLHVKEVAEAVGVELVTLRTKRTILEGLCEKGWPGWNFPWCQAWMHKALADWCKANYSSEDTLRLTGARAKQRKSTSLSGAEAPLSSCPEYQALAPCFDWTEESLQRILLESNAPLWEGYARGMARTCCWCCPGQKLTTYAALRREYPALFRAYEKLESLLGRELWSPHHTYLGVAAAADRGDELLHERESNATDNNISHKVLPL